jgi:hypothetical protein
VGQRTADLHARLRPDARACQPGHHRGSAGLFHSRPAAGLDGEHPDRSTEHLFRRAVEHLCAREDQAEGASLSKGDDNEYTTYDGDGGVSDRDVPAAAAVRNRFADTDILFTNQLTSESRILYHRKIADRVRCWRRSSRSTPIRIPSCPADECSGYRMRTRRRRTIHTRSRRRSRTNDQLHPQLGEDRHRCVPRSTTLYLCRSGRSAGANPCKDLPGLLQPMSAMPRTCGRTCGTRKTFSRFRRGCIRSTT